jgi:hypothetical protein
MALSWTKRWKRVGAVCEGLIAEKCRKAENMQKLSIEFPQVSVIPHPFPQKKKPINASKIRTVN